MMGSIYLLLLTITSDLNLTACGNVILVDLWCGVYSVRCEFTGSISVCKFIIKLGCLVGLPQVDSENGNIWPALTVFAKPDFSRY
jgi:hypothetical protein